MKQKIFFLLLLLCFSLDGYQRHIALVVNPDFWGEYSFAYRIQNACKNIDWKADLIDIKKSKKLKKRHYDFVINLVPGTYEKPKCKNYLAIFHPFHHFFGDERLKKEYLDYDGYLLTYNPKNFSKKNKDFKNQKKFPCFLWYPTVQFRPFQIVKPTRLFHMGSTWGNRFNEKKFQKLLQLLDNEPYMDLYGNPLFKSLYPKSYKGKLPFDSNTIQAEITKAGITLILHSEEHNKCSLPSGRIFEAASSAAVIICDQNPFVKEQFGDSILYINTDESSSTIFKQIQQHIDWINNNEEKALEKAKKAYDIYKEKFLLETMLKNLDQFHEKVSKRS